MAALSAREIRRALTLHMSALRRDRRSGFPALSDAGGTHEPSESVKWRRDPLQALSHAGIGPLERRREEGRGLDKKTKVRFFFSPPADAEGGEPV